jgi:hypothetical protein
MKRLLRLVAAAGAAALLLAGASPLPAATMGASGGYDLDQLWSAARKQFDTSQNDAVVLLEATHVSILTNGNRRTRVHSVVWIGSARGIRENADLRIPYNSATSTLTVSVLRTWRDNKWWPSETEVSPTAVVETVPYAVALADDYTAMRETMLLHDGVELPCILETVYEIEERGGAKDGCDGLWMFPQRDPAALVTFALRVPSGTALEFRSGNGAPEAEVTRDADQTVTYRWTMKNVGALGTPHIPNPASYAPHVSWSTWDDWAALGKEIVAGFDDAAVVDEALADTVAARLRYEPTPAAKARKIAAFVEEGTRSIHYDDRYWLRSPRPASRTWKTAYGHGLDRAVLAAALFRSAGFDAQPVFRSIGPDGVDPEVPGLSRFSGIALWVTGDQLQAFYDPVEGTLTEGPRPLSGRAVWKPGIENVPATPPPETASRFELIVTLEPGEDGRGWRGSGFLRADGLFSPYGEMVGLGHEARTYLGRIASSVLPGSSVNGYNLEVLEPDQVAVGFDLALEDQEPDDRGRTAIRIGDASGGVTTELQSGVFPFEEGRSSPILIPGKMTERITVRVLTGGRESVYLPEAIELSNDVGRYERTSDTEDGWVTVVRTLALETATIPPEAWPDLRSLLLEDTDLAGRTILMK